MGGWGSDIWGAVTGAVVYVSDFFGYGDDSESNEPSAIDKVDNSVKSLAKENIGTDNLLDMSNKLNKTEVVDEENNKSEYIASGDRRIETDLGGLLDFSNTREPLHETLSPSFSEKRIDDDIADDLYGYTGDDPTDESTHFETDWEIENKKADEKRLMDTYGTTDLAEVERINVGAGKSKWAKGDVNKYIKGQKIKQKAGNFMAAFANAMQTSSDQKDPYQYSADVIFNKGDSGGGINY